MIFECHGHIMLDGFSYAEAIARHEHGVDEGFVRQNLQINAEHGIGFYRDGGDKHGASAFARKIAHEYGIDYRSPIYIILKKGHYGAMFGRTYDNITEYRKLVEEAGQLGADFIKLTASGMLDFAHGGEVTGVAMSGDDLRETIKIAHDEGFAVMIHVNGVDSIKRAAEAGADSIEHGFYMDKEALEIVKQTGAIWVPTSAAVGNLIGKGFYDDDLLVRIFEGHKSALKTAAEMGIPIACGSDVGASCVIPGLGTQDELAILESIGIDPSLGNILIKEVFKKKC
ncbi:MAG: amidohydrolase family protein [Oscillospiraceae bacterium]|nr:amidohydrolase family protein [Oscillospiraceae bacterium]